MDSKENPEMISKESSRNHLREGATAQAGVIDEIVQPRPLSASRSFTAKKTDKDVISTYKEKDK